jgi:oxygen-independent coproporphyrinogen-3 oxidase
VEEGFPIQFESESITPEIHRTERIMLGLRLNQGVEIPAVERMDRLESRGWIERDGDRISLTRSGRHFCSEVALELI